MPFDFSSVTAKPQDAPAKEHWLMPYHRRQIEALCAPGLRRNDDLSHE